MLALDDCMGDNTISVLFQVSMKMNGNRIENVFLCSLQISLKISSHQYKREEVVWARV